MRPEYHRDAVMLVLAENGGWMLERYDGMSDRKTVIAAYSNDDDMLKALPSWLLAYRKARATNQK